jgi:hypothetical protein
MYKPLSGAVICDSQDSETGRKKKTVLIGGRVALSVYYDGNPDVATQAADEWAIETIGKIEKRLGRRLTTKELRYGLDLPETQNIGEIAAKKAEFETFFPVEVDSRTPLERARDARKAELKREKGDARLAMLDDAVEKERAEIERKAEKAKRDADPRRQAAIGDAGARVLDVLYNPHATQADLREALFRERVAKESDPVAYERLTREWQRAEAAKRRERATPLQQMVVDLKAELAELDKPFTLPATTTEYVSGEAVEI